MSSEITPMTDAEYDMWSTRGLSAAPIMASALARIRADRERIELLEMKLHNAEVRLESQTARADELLVEANRGRERIADLERQLAKLADAATHIRKWIAFGSCLCGEVRRGDGKIHICDHCVAVARLDKLLAAHFAEPQPSTPDADDFVTAIAAYCEACNTRFVTVADYTAHVCPNASVPTGTVANAPLPKPTPDPLHAAVAVFLDQVDHWPAQFGSHWLRMLEPVRAAMKETEPKP